MSKKKIFLDSNISEKQLGMIFWRRDFWIVGNKFQETNNFMEN